MKKLMLVLFIICAVIFSGCASKKTEAPALSLSPEGVEQILTETVTWENVLIENWN